MESFIERAMRDISKEKVVLDVGGGERFQKWLKQYEAFFQGTEYKTLDYDAVTNPDIVGDIHNLPLEDGSIGGIICSSVLEHVKDPIRAVHEMHRVLRSGGKIFVYVPSVYPYHARKGHYSDYWRFFDDTLEMLFADFASAEIRKAGGYFGALKFFFPMQHRLMPMLGPAANFLDRLLRTERRVTTSGYFVLATK